MASTNGRWMLLALLLLLSMGGAAFADSDSKKVNLVVILAEDLGYGDLGCFGQKTLKTPRLDAMAQEGMRFTQFYAGHSVSAPSRYTLLTGRHTGRAAIRGDSPSPSSIPADQPTVASSLKSAGYTTACVGKWGVGTPEKLSNPNDAGFDHFFGYVNAWHARNPYPEFLIRNGKSVALKNEVGEAWREWRDPALPQGGQGQASKRVDYAPDLLIHDALQFIREHQKKPFFLLYSMPAPQPKADDQGPDVPNLDAFASSDWPAAEKAFAGMVQNFDRDTGKILDLLKELKLERNTLVLFSSATGPNEIGGHRAAFFNSTGKLRGVRGDPFEGAIRMPTIAWWPGVIEPGSQNDLQWYAGDLMATAAELAELKVPPGLDSDSLVPALRNMAGEDRWRRRSPLYWESYQGLTWQVVRFGKWKAMRSPLFTGEILLYDMSNDTGEKHNYAIRRPDLARHAANLLNMRHQPDPNWKVSQ